MTQESKRGEVKAVSFKMPMRIWSVVQAAAVAHGVDVSSVLNWIIAQNLPVLVRLQAQREAALATAGSEGMADAVVQLLERIEIEEGAEAASCGLENLLHRLQAIEAERRSQDPGNNLPTHRAA